MAGLARNVASYFFTRLIVMVGALATPAAVIAALILFFSTHRTSGMYEAFFGLAFASAFSWWFLSNRMKKAVRLVESINEKNGLKLMSGAKLGHPSPLFVVFDPVNRKLAACNSTTGEHTVYDFNYVRDWRTEWDNVNVTRSAGRVGGIRYFERVQEPRNFRLVIGVNNLQEPKMIFPMPENRAREWSDRLNVMFSSPSPIS